MTTGARAIGGLAALGGLLLGGGLGGQEAPPQPSFPAEAEVVTVDVVVLDQDGQPVHGLTKSDFIVEDDGTPQEIVAFEVRDLALSVRPAAEAGQAEEAEAEPAEGKGTEPPKGGNSTAAEKADPMPGRTLALIVDDKGLDMRQLAALHGIKQWIRENADPRDEVTLLTSSGDVEWTGQIGAGRRELERALSRIRPGESPFEPWVLDPLTEWEAYQMVTGRRECTRCLLAQQVMTAWQERARGLVSAIERFAKDHTEERGRKAAVVFTKGFIQDDGLKADEQAIEAAQRANVALYFIDPRGLVAGYLTYRFDGFQPRMNNAPVARNSAADVAMSGAGDVTDGVAFGASHNLDLAGALRMADLTGGTLARHNDLKGALTQMVDESSAYYLLGYAAKRQADGKWHTLDVRVDRPSVTVRARRGYRAVEPASEGD